MKIPPSPSTINNQSWAGAVSESLVQYRLNKYGFPTVAAGLQLPYDLITEVHGQYYKVQVKGATQMPPAKPHHKPVHRFQLGCGANKSPYPLELVDIFAFVASDLERIIFIPADEVIKQKTMRFDSTSFSEAEQTASLEKTLDHLMKRRPGQLPPR